MPFNIPVLYGTMREGRKSEPAAHLVHAELLKRGHTSMYVAPADLHRSGSIERSNPEMWSTIMSEADALVVVSPEYNHGYPGALKEMLDSIYKEYFRKPIGICGAAGPMGGGRMIEQLRQVAIELHMVPLREALYFPNVQTMFDEKGQMSEENNKAYAPRIEAFMKELEWWTAVCKDGRANHAF